MTEHRSTEYALLGHGAAAMAAAKAICESDDQAQITVISEESHEFYSKPGLAYLLTGQIPEKELFPYTKSFYQSHQLEREIGRVISLDPVLHQLRFQDNRSLNYRRLLIATGAKAVRPAISGIELEGVVTLDTLDDARKIFKLARKAKRAVVIGGGITALELAEGFEACKLKTHYLLRKDRYWSNVLDRDESQLVEHHLQENGIQIHYSVEIVNIRGKKGKVVGIDLSSGEHLKCELVGIAIGILPRMELVKPTGIKTDRGILVDEQFRTSAPDVFAAGDVAQVWDPQIEAYVLDSLWWVAREQGRIAGINMVGGTEKYRRSVPFNVTRIGGITTTVIGRIGQGNQDTDLVSIARGDSETWRARPDSFAVEMDAQNNRLRLLVGERNIFGALVMGDQTPSRPLQHLISEEVDIRPIRKQLLAKPPNLSAIIQKYWEDWSGEQNAG